MSSQLFAFRVARPVETVDLTVDYGYDPRSQTLVWGGSGEAVAALHCTQIQNSPARTGCNAYGSYCTTYGSTVSRYGYRCDS